MNTATMRSSAIVPSWRSVPCPWWLLHGWCRRKRTGSSARKGPSAALAGDPAMAADYFALAP